MKRSGSEVKRWKRKTLCDKHDGKCAYCGIYVGMTGTIDHYNPTALGGTGANYNLRWSCITCNQMKSDFSPEEWEERMPLQNVKRSKQEEKVELLSMIAKKLRESLSNLSG